MAEKIYTIPVNEAFDKKDGCPFCALYELLVQRELESLMEGGVMEPNVRIETNKLGFCDEHFAALLGMQKRLPTALMMETHLSEHIAQILKGGAFAKPGSVADKAVAAADSCFICSNVAEKFDKMFECAAYLYGADGAFKKKLASQPYFCLRHYGKYIKAASGELSKKEFAEFYKTISELEQSYVATLNEDVSWYCKKFDYRYKDEDWKNSKDSIERTIAFVCGSEHRHTEK